MSVLGISIIVVNYGSSDKILNLYNSIISNFNSGQIKFEVIIVNNNKTNFDADLENLDKKIVKIIYNNKNLGYGVANNIGVASSNFENIILVNPDIEILSGPRCLIELIKVLDRDQVGISVPKIYNIRGDVEPNCYAKYSTLDTFMFQFMRIGDLYRLINKNTYIRNVTLNFFVKIKCESAVEYLNRFNSNRSLNFLWACGAFLCIKKSLFNYVGGFDDKFFLYSEDEDMCRRICALGYEIHQYSNYHVMHEGGGTQAVDNLFNMSIGYTEKIFSGIYYLLKYERHNKNIIKYAYIFLTVAKLFFNFKLIFNPIKSIKLIARIVKI